MIYLPSCNQCNLQYIGEIILALSKRINLHRKAKFGWDYVIKHFKHVYVGASFSVQVNEVFSGSGYNNNTVCPVNRETKLDREDSWIENLRTSYQYGLNKRRKRKVDLNLPVGPSFLPIPRSRERSARCRNNVNFDNIKDMESIFRNPNSINLNSQN